MADIRNLEHPTLKVPYENLNKRFKSAQKSISLEASHVLNACTDLEKAINNMSTVGLTPETLNGVPKALNELTRKMEDFKDRSAVSVADEMDALLALSNRVQHVRTGAVAPENAPWKRKRLDRLLVEHFLREGYYDTALKLAESSEIQDLTNIKLFLIAKEVEEALIVKDTSKCLAWCHDNKSKLRKLKSSLEFDVRLQGFIELVRCGKKKEALKYARKNLAQAATENRGHLAVVQTAMALLAFPTNTTIRPYKELLREDRWNDLIEEFRAENYRLYQLSNQSVFSVCLQAGLSALKTQKCYCDRNPECPVCQSPLNELAAQLPFAHFSQSRLICYVSGKPLNEHNQPMMLPNGYVYGEEALKKMATENEGRVICPRTKEIYSFAEAEKVYVM